ncbi:hypothetical protein NHQ30_008120 [Ciborinia camelliae]|nr:hypothetical protein NHQ30_008120 [Ciborinia camelliae]
MSAPILTQDPLDTSIQITSENPLSAQAKCAIINQLLGVVGVGVVQMQSAVLDHEMYLNYYTEQCNQALYDGGRHVSARTHRDIVETWEYFKNGVTREDTIQALIAKLPNHRQASDGDKLANGTTDLAARLVLMMEFGELKHGFTNRQHLVWASGSLSGFLAQSFQPPSTQKKVSLEKVFNAQNIDRIAGIEIEWTSNMMDHLRLINDDRKVAIFHHASFLECQLNNPIFPAGFIKETIHSLALLFPQNDKGCRRWFKKVSASQRLDKRAIRCGRLNAQDRRIENFKFWGERLSILKEVFDEAEPGTMSQWWCDRRKKVQWYTFWVAIWVLLLTVVFGIIQSVEGALQVYKAFQSS